MVEVGIEDGDLLICQRLRWRDPPAQPGDLVVAWYRHETTVKELQAVEGGGVFLAPRNRRYLGIYIPEERLGDLHIQGVVVMCWKHFAPVERTTTG
jgi:SOS-response transcriptional repressor LexA